MNVLIWVKNVAVLLLSLLFLIIGVNTLLGSYNIKNPLEFVMYFFSASLLILVCIVGIIYFFSHLFIKKQQNGIDNDETKSRI
jgi:predicted RND superfamily exporter protein